MKNMVFNRRNIKPVLIEILKQPEVLGCNYEFFEESPESQEFFEMNGEPFHIEEGEPGYEKRVQEVIDDNLFYLIGDDEQPDNQLINYLNDNLKYLSAMKFTSIKDFKIIKAKMEECVKDPLYLEDAESDFETSFDLDNPPDLLYQVFPYKKLDNSLLIDKGHKYVLISDSNLDGNISFDDNEYNRVLYLSLRDDCKLCVICEHEYKIKVGKKTIHAFMYELFNAEDYPDIISDAFLIDIVNCN